VGHPPEKTNGPLREAGPARDRLCRSGNGRREIVFRDDNALPAEMGVAAERARRLQERRSLLRATRLAMLLPEAARSAVQDRADFLA